MPKKINKKVTDRIHYLKLRMDGLKQKTIFAKQEISVVEGKIATLKEEHGKMKDLEVPFAKVLVRERIVSLEQEIPQIKYDIYSWDKIIDSDTIEWEILNEEENR